MKAATQAVQRRRDAKLLLIDSSGCLRLAARTDLAEFLHAGDLLVANDAATLPASLTGMHQRTGAGIEVRLAGRDSLRPDDVRHFTAVVFGAGDHRTLTEDRIAPPRLEVGDVLQLGPLRARVGALLGHPRLIDLHFDAEPDAIRAGLAAHGHAIQYAHVPQPLDLQDVWTRIAAQPVAFESPSAAYALDWHILDDLRTRGVGFVTLTHAAGISSTGDDALDARLPFDEPYHLPEVTRAAVLATRMRGGRVIALGTTVTRALEHAAQQVGGLQAGGGIADQRLGATTELRVVDAILSGTHARGSSHHELLRAFADDEVLARADRVFERCNFLTHEFGDSVLIERRKAATMVTSIAVCCPVSV